MEKLIVTETFSHADGEYILTYFTEDDPALKRASGSTPALVLTVELERHGSRQLVYRWAYLPTPGQRSLTEYTLATPQAARVPITLSQDELNAHFSVVIDAMAPKLDATLRREPMSRWKVVFAVLLFDAVFTFALWEGRIPTRWLLGAQAPLLACSYLYYLGARRIMDRPGRL